MIIGVCGTLASGKDAVANYLEEQKGYFHVSLGDTIRDYIREHKLGDVDRDNMFKVGNELREKFGSGFLTKEALKRHKPPIVVSGVRSPGEAEAIKEAGGILIAVDAPINKRYEWAQARGRIGDEITAEYFRDQEIAEMDLSNPNKIQITTVISMSDFDIANDGTLEELHAKIDDVLMRITPEEK